MSPIIDIDIRVFGYPLMALRLGHHNTTTREVSLPAASSQNLALLAICQLLFIVIALIWPLYGALQAAVVCFLKRKISIGERSTRLLENVPSAVVTKKRSEIYSQVRILILLHAQ